MHPGDLPHVAAAALPAMLDPAQTAVLVIDLQNDFAAPEAVARMGGDPAPVAAAIDRIEAVVAAARAAGLPIVFIRVITRPETDSRALKALYARKGWGEDGAAIARAGASGADYYRLAPQAGDLELDKLLFDSFHGTDLHARLQARGVRQLIVTGLTTNCCVDQTVRSAFHHEYDVFVVSDAVCAYSPDLHVGALHAMEVSCALLVTSTAVARALGGMAAYASPDIVTR